ncbi:hypothetical protein E4T38_09781 [Aureobasidium subglaciale]|nr:hypothetical protein E4T38_09781 [Aureobasidium subglaciale]KAI5213417.1 hypothetical protein E4T40_09753 [Aureobasidium subglaciale]KAI5214903.1 hypothetical protein E4T41_09782 [Aureobasidium subglaciale]KAI5252994.1 hypothetical protein E4T46_09758 [Aureobasidium subglaciale]
MCSSRDLQIVKIELWCVSAESGGGAVWSALVRWCHSFFGRSGQLLFYKWSRALTARLSRTDYGKIGLTPPSPQHPHGPATPPHQCTADRQAGTLFTVKTKRVQLPDHVSADASVADGLYKPFLKDLIVYSTYEIEMFLNRRSLFVWCLATLLEAEAATLKSRPNPIALSESAPSNAGIPLDSFVSFSFELSSWPDFAGNLSHPNEFSYNLLNNLDRLQGSFPIARVGGNTQDIAIFDENQKTGLVGVVRPNISADYPTIITIGPSFFESYKTMPKGTKYVHGFNLGANSSAARAATYASAPYACRAIGDDLAYWEYGNEPDLFHASGYRPLNYTEAQYVEEWLNGTTQIERAVKEACPQLAGTKFMAPSFAGVGPANAYFTLDPLKAFEADLNADKDIGLISAHNYMGVSTDPGITLQGTLMNHTNVIAKAAGHLNLSSNIAALGGDLAPDAPYILGEHNSLARQGRPGLSNSFGAALWGVDWNVYLASQNISRSHMHQGTNYRYQSWQPIQTNITTIGTKPPYYGNLAVAAMMNKPHPAASLKITHLNASSANTSFYTAHIDNSLSRILIVSLQTYNTTANNYTTLFARPVESYEFSLPSGCKGGVVQRLLANGSDALSGITWDGNSYNYELNMGKAVRLHNVTRGEGVKVDGQGIVKVEVPWSSAAIVSVDCY